MTTGAQRTPEGAGPALARSAGRVSDVERMLAELPANGTWILESLAVQGARLPWRRAGPALALLSTEGRAEVRRWKGHTWARRRV
ncbi:hypothetical protein WME76_02160 [Sorangium sp. So ce119]|uniref:hypothetical protein n=1 Tax=Sorangium sp. So ce119 TaxID=3133279 RepID=UPI003F5F4912